MISYTYSYLIADMVFLVIWFSLFIWRKDVRKQMLVISLTLGIIATFLEYIYIQDWWHPLTITHTIIGVEDFIFSFTISGISTVIYEEIFKKKIRLRKENSKTEIKRDKKMFLIIILCLALFLGGFYLLKLSSFYSSVLAFSIPLIIVLNKRKDLFLDSFISGIFLA